MQTVDYQLGLTPNKSWSNSSGGVAVDPTLGLSPQLVAEPVFTETFQKSTVAKDPTLGIVAPTDVQTLTQEPTGLSKTAMIGIGVGVLAVVVIGYWFIKKRG